MTREYNKTAAKLRDSRKECAALTRDLDKASDELATTSADYAVGAARTLTELFPRFSEPVQKNFCGDRYGRRGGPDRVKGGIHYRTGVDGIYTARANGKKPGGV
eukprot:739789-Prorocentrum_minimum.AAC.1